MKNKWKIIFESYVSADNTLIYKLHSSEISGIIKYDEKEHNDDN